MKSIISKITNSQVSVWVVLSVGIATSVGVIIGTLVSDNDGTAPPVIEVIIPTTTAAPTITSTTSTTTTTTTTTTLPPLPKPSKSSLMSEVEANYPGASKLYTEHVIRSGAEKACRDFNAGANLMGAIGSLRQYYINEFSVDDFKLAAAVADAGLKTVCPKNASYPKGVSEF